MAKTLLSMQDLRWRALAEIRKQPGCSDVQGIAINRVSDQQAENNWSLCVVSAGLLMPTPRLAPRSMSKASCAAIMILCRLDLQLVRLYRGGHRSGRPRNLLVVKPPGRT